MHKGTVTMRATVNKESPVDDAINWMYRQQAEVETQGYGKNKRSIQDTVSDTERKKSLFEDYEKELKQTGASAQREENNKLTECHKQLLELTDKKLNCLETLGEVASLEEQCCIVSAAFDTKAVQLVNIEERKHLPLKPDDHSAGFISPSSQDCVFAIKDNWAWIIHLVHCADIHLKNAAEYHQFFHEVDEVTPWMVQDIDKLCELFGFSDLRGDYATGNRLLRELSDIKCCYNQWESKLNHIWGRAIKVSPVHLRTNANVEPLPCRSLADYRTNEIDIREGEDLLLLDNSKTNMWKVKDARGKEALVPSVIVLIPAPFKEAIEAAVRVRLQLLAAWTTGIKRIGKVLIHFMLLVFKEWTEDEIKVIKSIKSPEREELIRILGFIDETLGSHWKDYNGFVNLQERMLSLQMILEQGGQDLVKDKNVCTSLVVQVELLEKLMMKYRELWKNWEMYKVVLETSQMPELMLIVDKWQQLQYVGTEYFTKFWQFSMPFEEIEKTMFQLQLDEKDGVTNGGVEETITAATNRGLQSAANGESIEMVEEEIVETTEAYEQVSSESGVTSEGNDLGFASETKTAQTEQISSAESEEKRTFIIKAVIDPRDNSEISLQQAIMLGILNPNTGVYVNPSTGDSMPIPVAMSEGSIIVEFSTSKKSKEKKSSVGIITVKTVREPVKKQVILSVLDTKEGVTLTASEARKKEILFDARGIVRDTKARREYHIADGIAKGIVQVEEQITSKEQEVEAKTYAVRAVVDSLRKKTITFEDAVKKGIIDKDAGMYVDSSSGEKMYIGDAIMRGFLKAREVDSDSELDVDPENRMVIDKTTAIKKKLVTPIGVIQQMKKESAARKMWKKK